MMCAGRVLLLLICAALSIGAVTDARAQDLEPRRWTHLPVGINVIGLGTSYTTGDIFLDPVLEIEDGDFELAGAAMVYLRTFSLFDRSARVDLLLPYATGRWEGLLSGEPASVRRDGFGDPRLRLSVLLYGGPAETPAEFATNPKSNTVVGSALSLTQPNGNYLDDRLINLGGN
ncbi:MAG: transporter, partial [Gammaproteobacteria bacterium]